MTGCGPLAAVDRGALRHDRSP